MLATPDSERVHRWLASALEAVRVHSPTTYSWFGQRTPPLPSVIRKSINGGEARDYLRHILQQRLYRHWYRSGAAVPPDALEHADRSNHSPTPFLTTLSKANTGTGHDEPGWRVHAIDGDHVVVQRDNFRAWARPDEITIAGSGPPNAGTPIAIHLPKELLRASPGFYVALGDEKMPPPGRAPIVRVYWNIAATAAPRLMRSATTQLNTAGIPFRLKMVSDPEGYTRCDAAVLYLPKQCYPAAEQIVAALHHESRDDISDAIPALTKQLAIGLGLAEDPGDGSSFGMHRCGLVAEGIIRAREQGTRSMHKRLMAVIACFSEAGIDSGQPYLNPGSVDTYLPLTCPAG